MSTGRQRHKADEESRLSLEHVKSEALGEPISPSKLTVSVSFASKIDIITPSDQAGPKCTVRQLSSYGQFLPPHVADGNLIMHCFKRSLIICHEITYSSVLYTFAIQLTRR